jgi:hypothetical protein
MHIASSGVPGLAGNRLNYSSAVQLTPASHTEYYAMTADNFLTAQLALFGCVGGWDGELFGAKCCCKGTKQCTWCPSLVALETWKNSLATPNVTLVQDGITEAMDRDGCVDLPRLGGDVAARPWTFIDRLWFSCVLLTTVGYGNTFMPSSPLSRQFTMLWALYGTCRHPSGCGRHGEERPLR